jgi:para-nitrobenzyl esterase
MVEAGNGSGDAGMLDIVRTLEWVRDNIAEFGGDPGTVTVFGRSGAGRKVATLLAMPAAKGLFHRAIIESGATMKLVEREQGARIARELTSTLGLPPGSARELQKLPYAAGFGICSATTQTTPSVCVREPTPAPHHPTSTS